MNQNTILLIGGAALAYFIFAKKGSAAPGAAPKAGATGTGVSATFNAPKSAATKTSSGIGDIGNYATQFANLTKTVSGLYDNYFGGSTNPGYNDPTALDNVDTTDTTSYDAAYLGNG
jgi:hypothetical protein